MKIVKMVTVLVLVGVLTSCSDTNSTQQKLDSYNTMVQGTIKNFSEGRVQAENKNGSLVAYVLQDKPYAGVPALEGLSSEQKKAFKVETNVYDKYFTALGSTGVREVLVFNGSGYRMYVTVIWQKGVIVDITRKVVPA